MLKSFKDRIRELKKTRSYCQEQAKLEFVGGITRLMKAKGINNSTLADRMESSSAYVTKALRGDANFTIDSMVKIAHSLGGKIHIHVADVETDVRWFEHITCTPTEHQAPPSQKKRKEEPVDISRILKEMQNEDREIYA